MITYSNNFSTIAVVPLVMGPLPLLATGPNALGSVSSRWRVTLEFRAHASSGELLRVREDQRWLTTERSFTCYDR